MMKNGATLERFGHPRPFGELAGFAVAGWGILGAMRGRIRFVASSSGLLRAAEIGREGRRGLQETAYAPGIMWQANSDVACRGCVVDNV